CGSSKRACAGVCDPCLGTSLAGWGKGCRTARDRCLVRGSATGGMLPPFSSTGLAVVRVAHDLCQRRVAPCPVPRRTPLAQGILPSGGGNIVRLPRSG